MEREFNLPLILDFASSTLSSACLLNLANVSLVVSMLGVDFSTFKYMVGKA